MKPTVKEIAIFGMLGALMYATKLFMEILPNIHMIGVFIVAITVVYRQKALYPIYVFVFLTGAFAGFDAWWLPYIYIWTVLWGFVMLLPKNIPTKIQPIVYMSVCALHGFLFGVLYAPVYALIAGLNFDGMKAWIITGIPWDITHGISNFVCGLLIVPIIYVLKHANRLSR